MKFIGKILCATIFAFTSLTMSTFASYDYVIYHTYNYPGKCSICDKDISKSVHAGFMYRYWKVKNVENSGNYCDECGKADWATHLITILELFYKKNGLDINKDWNRENNEKIVNDDKFRKLAPRKSVESENPMHILLAGEATGDYTINLEFFSKKIGLVPYAEIKAFKDDKPEYRANHLSRLLDLASKEEWNRCLDSTTSDDYHRFAENLKKNYLNQK